MTTSFADLQKKLQVAIGDKRATYADNYEEAINNAIREVYPVLFRHLDDKTLITGNALPNAHFEDWAQTTYPDFYSVGPTGAVVTATQTTTAGLIRGGVSSVLVKATDANGYMYISSDTYPKLLDLMGNDIDFKCWAYPEDKADDGVIEIYTIKADGTTTQTLTSSTSNPKEAFTLLELEDQSINDDIVEIQFRFKVVTASNTVYFDNARVMGKNFYEYLLPTDFRNGAIQQVFIQSSGYSDDICDDLQPRFPTKVFDPKIIQDGTYKYLQLPSQGSGRRIKLIGICPLEELTDGTDTISLDGQRVNLLIAYAAYLLYEMAEETPASEDISRYERASLKWLGRYNRLKSNLRMSKPAGTLRVNMY